MRFIPVTEDPAAFYDNTNDRAMLALQEERVTLDNLKPSHMCK